MVTSSQGNLPDLIRKRPLGAIWVPSGSFVPKLGVNYKKLKTVRLHIGFPAAITSRSPKRGWRNRNRPLCFEQRQEVEEDNITGIERTGLRPQSVARSIAHVADSPLGSSRFAATIAEEVRHIS